MSESIHLDREHAQYLLELIEIVASRGAIKAPEMLSVGHAYKTLEKALTETVDEDQENEPSL